MRNWWSRPGGGYEVLRIALPLIVSTASWSVMNFTDRMFLFWHSTDEMAAAMPAGMVHFSMLCFPFGLANYVVAFVAQYYGAQRPERIGLAVWQGVFIGLVCMPLFLATIPLAPLVFLHVGHDPAVARMEVSYFQIVAFAAGAEVIAAALSSFFIGRGRTPVVMLVDFAAACINIVLDYALIFGHWGFPEWGIAGAAIATVIALWFRVAAYAAFMWQPQNIRRYQLWRGMRFDGPLMRRLFYFGAPHGIQLLVEVAAFTVFLILIGGLGKEAQAATTFAFNINNLAWVPMLGLGNAISALVGQHLGRNQPELAARATWTAFIMAQTYLSLMAMLYLFVPDLFMLGHAAGSSPAEFAQLRSIVLVLLRFVAAYSLYDALNIIFASAIKGAGDTRFVLYTTALMSPWPVVAGWIGIHFFGGGLIWCWSVLTAWIAAMGLIYVARFVGGRWRSMRVIEQELPPEAVSVATGEPPAAHPPEAF